MKLELNRKGARTGKKEFSTQIVTKELFARFKKENPEYKKMKWKEFEEYWIDIAETIRHESVFNPLGVKLPYYLGELKTQFLPYKFEAVDASTSMQLGDIVNFLNILTRGKVAKIKWERRWAVKFNKMLQFYGFEHDRKIAVLARKHVSENPEQIRVARGTLGKRPKK